MTEPDPSSSRCFVDTNVWLYAFIDGPDAGRSQQARRLLRDKERVLVVSTQVINEVCVNLLKKAHLPEVEVQLLVYSFYQKYPVVVLDLPVQIGASQLRDRFSFSFWDSLIVAAAVKSEATILYSEDMQADLKVSDRLTIRNPFTD